ncbi:MAG: choline TMA-lyase-activating enzyme [Desulfovibrio sp.]|nr:choline TMA-lyase-activating enzyme [Desulfovibrio sp.]
MIERKALIFNVQKYNMYDGPGVRTLVFFKGCPLRCGWCSNPEGQLRAFQILYKKDNCVNRGACVAVCPAGVHAMDPATGRHAIRPDAECIGCRKCETACTASALAVSGERKTISELLAVIEEDRLFYETSGGGVTLGGGEALAQPEAALSLLTACRQRGIHTALETCGYARPEVLDRAAAVTDLFLYDVKHMDPERHLELTGARNETILGNLASLLENRKNVRIRVPLLKGLNDDDANIEAMCRYLAPFKGGMNCKGVDLLPYHKLGVNKYGQLGMEYSLPGDYRLAEADLERIEGRISGHGIPVAIIRH